MLDLGTTVSSLHQCNANNITTYYNVTMLTNNTDRFTRRDSHVDTQVSRDTQPQNLRIQKVGSKFGPPWTSNLEPNEPVSTNQEHTQSSCGRTSEHEPTLNPRVERLTLPAYSSGNQIFGLLSIEK